MRRRVLTTKKNNIRREFTLYTNQPIASQLDEIKELFISIGKLSTYGNSCLSKINNIQYIIAVNCDWSSIYDAGSFVLQAIEYTGGEAGDAIDILYSTFYERNYSDIYDLANNLEEIYEYSYNGFTFRNTEYFGDIINIELI